jgi:glyceraldehyde 3-phosphate dehydrogenase
MGSAASAAWCSVPCSSAPASSLRHVNDPAGDAATAAHLLAFDSVHGRWHHPVKAGGSGFLVADQPVGYTQEKDPTAVPWAAAGVDLVLECSGKLKTPETLEPYFSQLA